jgi:hypothetical protein
MRDSDCVLMGKLREPSLAWARFTVLCSVLFGCSGTHPVGALSPWRDDLRCWPGRRLAVSSVSHEVEVPYLPIDSQWDSYHRWDLFSVCGTTIPRGPPRICHTYVFERTAYYFPSLLYVTSFFLSLGWSYCWRIPVDTRYC